MQGKQKICFVIAQLGDGGAERVLLDLANHFSNSYEVHIVTFEKAGTKPHYDLDKRITLHQLDLLKETPIFLDKIRQLFVRVSKLRKKLIEIQAVNIISFIDVMNVVTLLATRFMENVNVIVSERTDPKQHNIPRIYHLLRKLLYPFANKVVLQSKQTAESFPLFRNLEIIPNAIHQQKDIKNNFVTNYRLIFIGRLIASKNIDWLLENLDHRINFTLDIYGEGREREALQHLIEKLNLNMKVTLKGNVKNIPQRLLEYDVFVFPSKYEGFPNALAEAMVAGLPVLASDISGNNTLIESGVNGLLFKSDDKQDFGEKLEVLLSSERLRKKLGTNAHKSTAAYAPERIYELWKSLL